MSVRRALLASLLFPLAACGGGSSPTGPGPTPTPGGTQSVTVVVFYDENGNGSLDASEMARVPGVDVSLGGHTARSAEGTGRAVIEGVAPGTFTPAVSASTLPPFYAIGRLPSVQAPTSADVAIPLTLPIGANRPNLYMTFGDSITEGNNYPGDPSYSATLGDKLRQHFGRASVVAEGVGSTKSNQGADRVDGPLNGDRPAYTLILYGTNDYTQSECNNVAKLATTCFTIPSLRDIIQSVRGAGSLPVIATIPPVNTGFDFRAPPQRNDWVSGADVQIRNLAVEQGAALADVEAGFLAVGDTSVLFVDSLHPNAAGEEVIATAFLNAIAHGARTGSAFTGPVAALDAPALLTRPRSATTARTPIRRR
jgi:lysophospholipase L1-like esterase